MKHKFYVKDCPDDNVPHYWINEKTNLQYYMDNMKPVNTDKNFLSFKQPNIDLTKVQQSCESAFEKFGFFGFLNIYGKEMFRDIDYILESFHDRPHVFNLGHGITPSTPVNNVQSMIDHIRNG